MLANHKGEIPFLILILPFLLGIVSGLLFAWDIGWWLIMLLASSGSLFIGLNLTYKKFKLYKHQWLGGTLIGLILFLVGWLSVSLHNELSNQQHFSKTPAQFISVQIHSEPIQKNDFIRFTARVMQSINNKVATTARGTLMIAIKDSMARRLNYGDQLLIPASFTPVDAPHNPAEFNYKKYLTNQNIHHQVFLYPGQYVVTATNKGNRLVAYSLGLRRMLVEKFKRNMRDTSAIAVASTLILGYKADLSEDVLQAYSKTGTIHILSVSGGHVAILYLLLGWLLSFLNGYKNGRLIKAIIITSLIGYYALLTGLSPAVCRAAVMITLIIIGKTYNRYINQLNILAIAAFFMLLYNPYFVTDVGFQLSYLAVGGLVVLQPIIYRWISVKNKLADMAWMACSVSLAAQLITFPLSAFYFHQFPVYFLLSNLLIAVPVMVIMYAGLLYLLLPQLPFVSAGLALILEQTILWMNKGLALIEHSPFANIGKIWLTTSEYLLLYAILVCALYFIVQRRTQFLKLGMALTLVLCISVSIKKVYAAKSNTITFLNLKKYRGLVFKQGDKAVILTDLNPIGKNYRYAIQPYLDSTKIADTTVILPTLNLNKPYFRKAGDLIQFQNTKLYVLDENARYLHLPQKIKINYLYVTKNPHWSLERINKQFDYEVLIIDASNSNKTVDDLSKQAATAGINYKIIKRNNALVLQSN